MCIRLAAATHSAADSTEKNGRGTSAALSRCQAQANSPQVTILPHQAVAGRLKPRVSHPHVQ